LGLARDVERPAGDVRLWLGIIFAFALPSRIFQLEAIDWTSFHNYNGPDTGNGLKCFRKLAARCYAPIYGAGNQLTRLSGTTLPVLKKARCFLGLGLVTGKSNTNLSRDSWVKRYTA